MTHLITLNRQKVWKLNILPKSWNSSSKASILSFDLQKEIGTWACNQFWAQTKFWTMRGEWISKWIKYTPSGTKYQFRSNHRNRCSEHISGHFGQHLVPILIGFPPPQNLKFQIPSTLIIFNQIFFNLIATPYRLLSL